MLFIQISIIAIWIIPVLFVASIYMKMDNKDRGEIRTELKRPSVYLGLGIPVIGALLLLTGIFSAAKWIQHVGVIMLLGSWLTTSVISWKKGKTSAMTSATLLLIGLAGALAYGYLI